MNLGPQQCHPPSSARTRCILAGVATTVRWDAIAFSPTSVNAHALMAAGVVGSFASVMFAAETLAMSLRQTLQDEFLCMRGYHHDVVASFVALLDSFEDGLSVKVASATARAFLRL